MEMEYCLLDINPYLFFFHIHRVQRSNWGVCYVQHGVSALKRKIAKKVTSFAFLIEKGPSLIKIITVRNRYIIVVYKTVKKVDVYGVVFANTRAQV